MSPLLLLATPQLVCSPSCLHYDALYCLTVCWGRAFHRPLWGCGTSYPSCHLLRPALCRLKGVFDIRRALDASQAGLVLHPLVLGAIGLTLEAAQQVDAALQSGGSFPALLQLADGLRGGVPEVQAALFQCIQVDG